MGIKNIQDLLAAMKAAGCSPDQILAAVSHQAEVEAEKETERKAKRAAQKRSERARKADVSPDVAATTSDIQRQGATSRDLPSLNGSPPTPYIRNIDNPPSLNPPINNRHSAHFERFWKVYPRKVGKGQALKAWNTAVRKADPESIIEGAERYPWPEDPSFVPHASTWLNGQRWEDELPGMKPKRLSQAEMEAEEAKRIEYLKQLHRRAGNAQ